MSHINTQILVAAAGRLVSMTEVDDADVYQEHAWNLTDDHLPAVDLTLPEDTVAELIEDQTLGEMLLVKATLFVDAYAKLSGDGAVGNKLRAIAAECIGKLISSASDTKLGGLVTEIDYVGSSLELGVEEKPIGRLRLEYSVTYRRLAYNATTSQS